ncbi:UDP-N-acetylmuramoyl-tripeptide--D-alanyl-D-alanine ligase [Macrococcus equipercicus]|uniref:UDP-N-acetylmuramoyl-tripeptide--D-alanyl-D-alanine ligase n=1 Tax=Macrococcus equipercicus TaxID=69967 RepID=A0A9Q9BKZ9_9STAP|nr:UDP-N-acetylmuramoyl-tripeptide--D-alanyl-D-alanine ligase [Macrococcus equipercicus]UTH13518.1 UDP-N-acetylmuramoyl-tripeptide--D-alanyl-D-alanine ligase [Macrococcus equipercicus]
MIKRTLQEIAQMAGGTVSDAYKTTEVAGVAIDSRKITEGVLFIPFKGEQTDGHRFVSQAIADGAAASFWQEDVPGAPADLPLVMVDDCLQALQRLSRAYLKEVKPKVIGITGSNGKTTTKDIVSAVLSPVFKVKKTFGNYNNEIGLPLTICQLDDDTEISILEMGMSGFGEISLLSTLAEPDVAVITNIGESHMRDLGSRAGIARAKFEITDGLSGLFIYDGDEPLLAPLAETYKGERAALGLNEDNPYRITDIHMTDGAIQFKVTPSDTVFTLPMLGIHNARNAAIAILIGRRFGLTDEAINMHLQQLEMTGMRMEQLAGPNGSLLINDAYNASPTSMKAAIDTVNGMTGDKYIVLSDVLELGPDEEQYHREVGKYFDGMQMTVITTGRAAEHIHDEAKKLTTAYHFDDKGAVAEFLRPRLTADTVVLFKASRGMALETIIENISN